MNLPLFQFQLVRLQSPGSETTTAPTTAFQFQLVRLQSKLLLFLARALRGFNSNWCDYSLVVLICHPRPSLVSIPTGAITVVFTKDERAEAIKVSIPTGAITVARAQIELSLLECFNSNWCDYSSSHRLRRERRKGFQFQLVRLQSFLYRTTSLLFRSFQFQLVRLQSLKQCHKLMCQLCFNSNWCDYS